MPTYTFKNIKSGRTYDERMTIAEREKYLANNKNVEHVVVSPLIVSGVAGARKTDDSFKDVLRNMQKKHQKGNIDPDAF